VTTFYDFIKVGTALSGSEALDRIDRKACDLLLVKMPEMTGLEFYRKLWVAQPKFAMGGLLKGAF